ncbi:hypothetical protein DPMN_044249 [Dreissena polymorpha]|uniref:Uncharacterized protein n=1 Tax=Dreissena polymorpha TaxID=45954 RepID=A0A9D4D1X9_DREPO|nr:hypothetical protein DPMN_044249 [Dreissena polymorpha]
MDRQTDRRTDSGHVLKATKTFFELIHDIIGTNLLTKFYDDRKINVTSRVLTRKMHHPHGGHVFQLTRILFELVQDIIVMNLLTESHEDRTINVASRVKNAPPLGNHFHEDRKINVASRVLTRKNAPPPGVDVFQPTGIIFKHDKNVASREKYPPLGSHVFQANVTIFELIHSIIETNLLTEFHDDWTINVAC